MLKMLRYILSKYSRLEIRKLLFYIMLQLSASVIEAAAFILIGALLSRTQTNVTKEFIGFLPGLVRENLYIWVSLLIILRIFFFGFAIKRITFLNSKHHEATATSFLRNTMFLGRKVPVLSQSSIFLNLEIDLVNLFTGIYATSIILSEIVCISVIIVFSIWVIGIIKVLLLVPLFLIPTIIVILLRPQILRAMSSYRVQSEKNSRYAIETSQISTTIFDSESKNYLISKFSRSKRIVTDSHASIYFWSQAPKYIIETLIYLTFAIFIGISSDVTIIDLLVIAPVSLRILPSFIKIVSLQSDVQRGVHALAQLSNQESNDQDLSESRIFRNSNSILTLELTDLVPLAFNIPLTKQINLKAREGEIIAVIGESGAGKTSLIEVILGLRKSTGKVEINGPSNLANPPELFGYVPQNPRALFGSISENVSLLPEISRDDELIVKSLRNANLGIWASKINQKLDETGAEGLKPSGGELARLGLARLMYSGARIWLLDEVTAGLDDLNTFEIMSMLKHLSTSRIILVVTHSDKVSAQANQIIKVNRFEA